MFLPPPTGLTIRGMKKIRNVGREEGSVVGRERGMGGGREVGVKAGMEERGRQCAWEDGSNGWRKGGTDGRNGG